VRVISYREALNEALREEMKRDERVFLMGEDVGVYNGVYKVSKGLLAEFGPERVRDTPISEEGFTGAAIGAAIAGMKPIVEIMYNDFICLAMNQIVNFAAKMRYMSGGQLKVPIVIRTMIGQGRGRGCGGEHSQVLIPWFINVPGLKVVTPATPYDAKGLLKTAIRDEAPVIFFEAAKLYSLKGNVPEEEYTIPMGKADKKMEGKDVTLVAISTMVPASLSAANKVRKEDGISVEVIDPRTLIPLDKHTIISSVKKTGRLIVAEPCCKTGGIGAEIAAMVYEEAFDYLDHPVVRVAALDIPVPVSPPLEKMVVPNEDNIVEALRNMFTK